MGNVWSMTKKGFCFKTPFFAKNAIFSKIMSQSKDFFWLIQAPNISKHISRNGGATIKASRKQLMTIFLILGQKVIALNMCIGTNVLMYERWLVLKVRYTAGRPALRPNSFAIP